jgi:hypothetical protein
VRRLVRGLAVLLIGLVAGADAARAACTIVGVQSVSPAILPVGTYTATTLPPPVTLNVTVTLLVSGNGGSCKGEYGLVRLLAPAQMTRVPPALVGLPYGVTSVGSQILSFGTAPTQRRRLPNFNVRHGETTALVSLPFTITPQVPAGVPPLGSYLDQLALHLFDVQGNRSTLVGIAPLLPSAQVDGSCSLSAPGGLSMNFTPDVATGIPQGASQTVSFNVNCTSPARVQLSGTALSSPVAGTAVFDNFIDYRATATFGGTSATLTTSGSTPVNATSSSQSASTGTNLPVGVDVRLIPRRPLIGSTTYTGVLRVTVDPAL